MDWKLVVIVVLACLLVLAIALMFLFFDIGRSYGRKEKLEDMVKSLKNRDKSK